jgi:hypothetical protein
MRLVLGIFGQPAVGAARAALLRRALALAALLLIAATWRLWTPEHAFPQVPLVSLARHVPSWCDWVGAAAMIAGLALALLAPGSGRVASAGLFVYAAATSALVLLDQMRLQAWAYQFVLMALLLALADRRTAFALLRLFIASFYFHSALSKLDHAFLHTLGQQFAAALAGAMGASLDGWSDGARMAAAAVFPAGELAVALGLCFPRTRLPALIGALVLHVLLLVILGPAGLDHKPGVLIWNAYFIVQDVLLFAGSRLAVDGKLPEGASGASERLAADGSAARRRGNLVAAVLAWAAVLLPFLAPTAWFDLWPSWGLYAPSAERVMLLVHRRERDFMPDEWRAFVEESADPADPWLRVRLDRMALDRLGAPLYPQNRCQLGVAEAMIARYAPGQRFRVLRFELAERFTSKRQSDVLESLPQLTAAGGEYFLNTRPRPATFEPGVR